MKTMATVNGFVHETNVGTGKGVEGVTNVVVVNISC